MSGDSLLHPVTYTAAQPFIEPYMTTTPTFLPRAIELPSGVTAKIELTPAPQPDAAGNYPLGHQADIHVSLFRNDTLLERRRWDSLICGAEIVTLADGTALDADDLYDLDSAGWNQMLDFGMMPSVWVG